MNAVSARGFAGEKKPTSNAVTSARSAIENIRVLIMSNSTNKGKPIIFNGDMVRALLDGSKTQTRRVVKTQPMDIWPNGQDCYSPARGSIHYTPNDVRASMSDDKLTYWGGCVGVGEYSCPFGSPGDLLWVRETFCPIYPQDQHYNGGRPIEYDFKATYQHGDRMGDLIGKHKRWTPSIHMPRWASRITMKITDIRVERLQDISEEDAQSEGTERGMLKTMGGEFILHGGSYTCGFINLWQSIYGPDSWAQNPWVWVIEFEVIRKNIDDVIREMGAA